MKEPGAKVHLSFDPKAIQASADMVEDLEDFKPKFEHSNLDQMQSNLKKSVSTNLSSMNAKYPNARELSESFSTKLKEMKWIAISLGVNLGLLILVFKMSSGIEIPFPKSTIETFGSIVVEVLLLLANVITFKALDNASAALFGSLFAAKHGYSLAAGGFQQALPVFKFSFCSQLSLNSTCRKFLTRISGIWVLLEFLKLLTVLSATSVQKGYVRGYDGSVDCIEYLQKNAPVDRQWPNVRSSGGYAELVFGSSLGVLRSEVATTNVTLGVFSPQIIGAVNNGDTIAGNGFVTTIQTTCGCTTSYDAVGLQSVYSGVSTADANYLLTSALTLPKTGLISRITSQGDTINITSIISNSVLCGGTGTAFAPVCSTQFSNHVHGSILISYMTDGTTASIAANSVNILSNGIAANMTWVKSALVAIFEGENSILPLPPTIPGTVNPLLWWTTPNLLASDPAALEAGMETLYAILLRAGMQRTFATKGTTCPKNVINPSGSVLTMPAYGVNIAVFILSYHFLVSLLSILCYIPWLRSKNPIGPAVRALHDHVYFTTLLNSSATNFYISELCNAPTHELWQALDITIRIGESIQTTGEDVGHICLEKPKLAASLTNGKKYY